MAFFYEYIYQQSMDYWNIYRQYYSDEKKLQVSPYNHANSADAKNRAADLPL